MAQYEVIITEPGYREKDVVIVFDMDEVLLHYDEKDDTITYNTEWRELLSFLKRKCIHLILWTRGDYTYTVNVLFTCNLLLGFFEQVKTLKDETTVMGATKSGYVIRAKYPTSHIILIDDTPENGDEAYDLIIPHTSLVDTKYKLLTYLINNKLLTC